MNMLTLADIDRAITAARGGDRIHPIVVDGRSVYLMTITPAMRATLVMIEAKARWKSQYRAERLARRGVAE